MNFSSSRTASSSSTIRIVLATAGRYQPRRRALRMCTSTVSIALVPQPANRRVGGPPAVDGLDHPDDPDGCAHVVNAHDVDALPSEQRDGGQPPLEPLLDGKVEGLADDVLSRRCDEQGPSGLSQL